MRSRPKIPYFNQWKHLDCDVPQWQQEPSHNVGRDRATEQILLVGGSVLDVGCGVSHDYPNLQTLQYVGLDVTRKFLVEGRKQGLTNSFQASCLQLPFQDNSFTTVYIKDLMVHLPPGDWKLLLKEAYRVASVQVVTLEGQWLDEPNITIMEQYGSLRFYNNGYYGPEVIAFARECGVKSIRYYMHKTVNWQVTVYEI